MPRKPYLSAIACFSSLLCLLGSARLDAQATVRVMPLGDSITFGMGAGQAQIPGGYRDPLAYLYAAGTVPFLFVGSDSNNSTSYLVSTGQQANEGHTGFRIDQIQNSIASWQSSATPDVVLLHIGTNDILQNFNLGTGLGNDTSAAIGRLTTLITTLYSAKPDLRVVLSTLIPIQDARDEYVKNYNAALASTVVPNFTGQGKSMVLVDNYANFVTNGSWDSAKFADYAHPNATGYAAMAATWATIPLPVVEGIVFTPSSAALANGKDSALAVNLVRTGQPSLAGVSAPTGTSSGTFPVTGLNDGSTAASANFTYYSVTNGNGGATKMPDTVTFELNTTVNTSGYDISTVQAISGWGDHNLGAQRFQLWIARNHEEYVNFGTFVNAAVVNGGNSSFLSTIGHSTGTLAGNVTGVRYVFMNPDPASGATVTGPTQAVSSGGTVIRELQVFGAPSAALPPQPCLLNRQTASGAAGEDGAIAVNLLRAGQPTLAGVTAPTGAISATFSTAGLNNGSAAASANMTYYAVTDSRNGSVSMPDTITFELNTAVNTAGYDLASIQAITGWGDHSLGAHRFQLLLSINNGPYQDYGTYRNADVVNGGNSSFLSTLTAAGGTIASHVTGLRFIFMNPDAGNGAGSVGPSQAGGGSNGGTVIRELQAFGTPSPATASYETWATENFLAGDDALELADPNDNGISNLMEYALGGNPTDGSTGTGILPSLQMVAGHATLSFNRLLDRTDLTLTVQVSPDLLAWTGMARSIAGGDFSALVAGTGIVETGTGNTRPLSITDPVETSASAPRFLRLTAEK